MTRASAEAERRQRARARKAPSTLPVAASRPYGWEWSLEEDCPDPANHKVCPSTGEGHDWCKPHPRPADHKYECAGCGHYDLDDYR